LHFTSQFISYVYHLLGYISYFVLTSERMVALLPIPKITVSTEGIATYIVMTSFYFYACLSYSGMMTIVIVMMIIISVADPINIWKLIVPIEIVGMAIPVIIRWVILYFVRNQLREDARSSLVSNYYSKHRRYCSICCHDIVTFYI
jgi:hypothetical protein